MSSDVPATRTLPQVLRAALDRDDIPVTMRIYVTGAALPAGAQANGWVNIVRDGTTIKVPKLAGARVIVGAPAYVLHWGDFALYLGTVATT